MNFTTRAFYDAVSCLLSPQSVADCKDLSGVAGASATQNFDLFGRRYVILKNGEVVEEGIFKFHKIAVNKEAVGDKYRCFHAYIRIVANDKAEESASSAEDLKALLRSLKHHRLQIHLFSGMGKNVQKFIRSLPCVSTLIGPSECEMTEDLLKTIRHVVEKKTLNFAKFATCNTKIVLALLKQEQLERVQLPKLSPSLLYKIIEDWKVNAEKMAGKLLTTSTSMKKLQSVELITRITIGPCTEQEKAAYNINYPRVRGFLQGRTFTTLVSRNATGRAIYWNFEREDCALYLQFA